MAQAEQLEHTSEELGPRDYDCLEIGFILCHTYADFSFGYLTVISIFQLEHGKEFKEFDICFIHLIKVGNETPPFFELASDYFPLAFKFSLLHGLILQILRLKKLVQMAPALGPALICAGFQFSHSVNWRHQARTFAATARKRSATRSGVSPLLINASAPAESAAC